jgi:hypothetical protein
MYVPFGSPVSGSKYVQDQGEHLHPDCVVKAYPPKAATPRARANA